jgi:hypothetical protein
MALRILLFFLLPVYFSPAQGWSLKLSSNVELRSWKLNTAANKTEKSLSGAAIVLYKGNSIISQTTSDANGDFVIDIPGGGDFILTVSFAGCNTKKFYVSTNSVPENVGKDNYKPTVSIGGFVMSKPIQGVDYIGLNEPLVKVEYKAKGQNFDKDETVTNQGLNVISKISQAENVVIDKFCSLNKQGDEALKKRNCPLAKSCYQKAIALMSDEKYPVEQLAKAEECIKQKQDEDAAAEMARQARQAEIEKAAKDKAAKDQAAKDKAAADKAAKEKAVATKTVAEKPKKAETASNNDIRPRETADPKESDKGESGSKGNSKYRMPQVLGADKYKEAIGRADNYFKSKRYQDAKVAYQEALKLKANDSYATGRISECNKQIGPN